MLRTCVVSGGGALAVALLARRGLRWLLRWRAPRSDRSRHTTHCGCHISETRPRSDRGRHTTHWSPLSSASNAIPPRSPTARWWLINPRLPFSPTVADRSLLGPLVAQSQWIKYNHCTTDRNTIQWIQPYNGSKYHTMDRNIRPVGRQISETRPRSDRGCPLVVKSPRRGLDPSGSPYCPLVVRSLRL